MFKQLPDGSLVPIPDDERVTPDLADLRVFINRFLQAITADTPQNRALRKQYYEGRISDTPGMNWYADPDM